ncbi:hypothetical protein KBB89_01075 [Candidatus Gracilibacteria bacterium]|nr:hypothetical protein [Candidatus Gracilibacteria bacterium]
MFRTNFLQDDQSYLVADYDHFSLTVGVLKFVKRVPHLEYCVRSFFPPDKREFSPKIFEQYFTQCCSQLRDKLGTIPEEVCVFLDNGESITTSTGYTFTRGNSSDPVHLEELDMYAGKLLLQSNNQAKRLWEEDYGYRSTDKKLISIFLSHLALDKKHYTYPLGKNASHVTMRCLFFYGSQALLDGISRSILSSGHKLLTCVPLPCVFLNHLCNKETFLDNHLHIHLGYDSTTAILHLGKHVQEIQTIPFGWEFIDQKMESYFSPLERESLLMGTDFSRLADIPEWSHYKSFLTANLMVLFERFDLQWSFTEYSVSSQGPAGVIQEIASEGLLSPWIQRNANFHRIGADKNEHWLHYWNTLDPLFTLHPHPLLALVRSVFLSSHESN